MTHDPKMVERVERMGEALFALSESIRPHLRDDKLHTRYEDVVVAWQYLAEAIGGAPCPLCGEVEVLANCATECPERIGTDGEPMVALDQQTIAGIIAPVVGRCADDDAVLGAATAVIAHVNRKALAALKPSHTEPTVDWKCGRAGRASPGGADPVDCNYPHCGCDPNTEPTVGVSDLRARIAEVVAEGDGFWRPCSGCQESCDGAVSINDYPYSDIFKCQPGAGCGECGGIGVVWDDTDYEDMARSLLSVESEGPSGPENVLAKIDAVLAKIGGEG